MEIPCRNKKYETNDKETQAEVYHGGVIEKAVPLRDIQWYIAVTANLFGFMVVGDSCLLPNSYTPSLFCHFVVTTPKHGVQPISTLVIN